MIISRYLTRELCISLSAVIAVLMLTLLSQQFVRYLNYAAVGKIPVEVLLELVSFEVPYLLALLLPLSLYIGIILAYGRLYAENEMSILHMCGFNHKKITFLTLINAAVVASIVLCLMLWVNPWISAKRQTLLTSDQATVHLVQTLIPGRFQVSPDGRHVMYVEEISRDHMRAKNVFLAQEKKNTRDDDLNAWMLVTAQQGYQIKEKQYQDHFFVTTNGYRYEGKPGQNDYKIIQFGKYYVRIPQNNMQGSHFEEENLPTLQLLQNYANPKHAAEFQWRFSIAISTFLLALLAISFSTVKPRQGKFLMLIPAMIIYILYFNWLYIARHWIEQDIIPSWMGIWWVHGIVFLIAMLIMSIRFRKQYK